MRFYIVYFNIIYCKIYPLPFQKTVTHCHLFNDTCPSSFTWHHFLMIPVEDVIIYFKTIFDQLHLLPPYLSFSTERYIF